MLQNQDMDIPEPLKLTTINNDCKEIIFDLLEWRDLINVAETSRLFHTSVCHVFRRKYSGTKIAIGCDFITGYNTVFFYLFLYSF